jgi:uncharacterized membrane protein YgcG
MARWAGVLVAAVAVFPCSFVNAQATLTIGETAADGRVEVTVTATSRADEFGGFGGAWFVADVRFVGVGGIETTAILDWRLRLPDGTEAVPFPAAESNVPGGTVGPGSEATIRLGFRADNLEGPAELLFHPFLDDAPLATWSTTLEALPATVDPSVPLPDMTIPDFSIPGVTIPDIDIGAFTSGSGFEQVRSFDARYEIQPDTTILVTETIEYDFASAERHGIFRDLALYQPIDDDRERRYPISEIDVEGGEGTPDQFEVSRFGDFQRIKIGDADVTITGVHTYTIEYRLAGAMNPQPDGPELYFNVTGMWAAPMAEVTVEVAAPGGVERVACFAGPAGSTDSCSESTIDAEGVAHYRQDGLGSDDQLTIVAALPAGSVAEPLPILTDAPRDVEDAVEPGPLNVGGAAAVLLAGIAGVGVLLWRHGRDLEGGGSVVDARFAPDDAPARRLPFLRRVETPVEFEPPAGVRPGLVGTLYDEQADPVDVSATIVDLAVRGFLRIEEVPKEGWFGKGDHRLVSLRDDDGTLMAYERMLLRGLFEGGASEVLLSDLKDEFASTLAKIRSSMYSETVRQRWFERRPDKTRGLWIAIGAGISVVGAGALVLAFVTKYAVWPAAALCLIGLVFLVVSRRMPRRTARGTAALRHVEGFRRFITDSERYRSEFDERANLFTEYLPYSIVFGCVDKWAKAFADLHTGELPDTGMWYVGTHRFDAGDFSRSMNGFATTAGSTMSSTPGGSGGSGFSGGSSGGGGGGGGGGSW